MLGKMRDDTKPQPPSPPRRPSVFQVPVTGERSKRWMKHYRTEIAASTSSVLSTFVAVSALPGWRCGHVPYLQKADGSTIDSTLSTLSRHACKRKYYLALRDSHTRKGLRMSSYKFPTFTGCVQHTYKTEGTLGFWRGEAPSSQNSRSLES
jgi:solute carrier family 25 (mitochondrial carnitine/acylcarnitine transporter), member 20/29